MLRELLVSEETLVVPGTYDALSALIAKQAGFKALYMSGFGVAGALLGKPDIGLVSAREMIERASQIVTAVGDTPLIADGDNGYGDEQAVAELVNAYEQAGVQCIQLEDQVSPKRCGHMDNKEVIDLKEAVAKLAMAARSRNSDQFLIVARTDSRATHDLDEALRRGEAFLNAGADILFIEAPQSVDEMQVIKRSFPETVLVANMVEDGKTPELTTTELAELGYQLILRPVSALLAATKTLQQSYASLTASDPSESAPPRLSFKAYNELVGLADYN
jgi:2-methylisocitrate lyase-like PEP mutase family enzyme|tara:strand:- start:8743 stop:9570 length:828 start_codon:yes stop_codon:yes gene_type:complete